MLPDRVSNPGPLTYESGALPIAPRGPAIFSCSALISSLENGLTGDTVITWVIILSYQRAQIRAFFNPCSLA